MWASGLSHTCCFGILPNKASFSSFTPSLSAFNLTVSDPESTIPISLVYGLSTGNKATSIAWEKEYYSRLVVKATAKTEKLNDGKEEVINNVVKEASVDPKEAAKLARRAKDWERALKFKENGSLQVVKVEACNSGGLVVRLGSLAGFLPFSQMSSSHIPKDGKTMVDVGKDLIGKSLSVKVIDANKDEKRLVFSEKQAVWLQSVQQIKGDVFEGRVNYITDFGAFIDLRFPDGTYPVTGLVHVSELSWDPVLDPRDVLQEGQDVQVKLTNMDMERMRLALSMKQLQGDPLLETLDTLMPQEDSAENDDESSTESLSGLADICQELLQEEGINEVTPGRLVLEKRVVSQDLELWLSSANVEDGNFTLLARAGRQVQEVHLKTSLDREGIKAAVQRVTGRVP